MGKVLGIDLGTTNSCVTVLEGGKPVVIPNTEGGRTTPSIVAFTEHEDRLVGNLAKRQAITNPKNTILAVKRMMGRSYDSPDVERIKNFYKYELVPTKNGNVGIKIFEKIFSPQQISAFILEQLKVQAEEYLGETVEDAVITVPAYFNDAQRQATRDAGRIAGLNVLRIINEPTAASLAYGLDRTSKGKIAIYDFGGGTFDISVLDVGDGVFQVKATHGDTFLGGEDVDITIMNALIEQFREDNGIDLSDDPIAVQRLKEASEKVKIELSSTEEADISLPFIYADESGPKHLKITMSREHLEDMADGLIQKTLDHCQQALDDAGMAVADLDDVILVGGQTKMPKIQRLVKAFFKIEPNKKVNPDEAVAIGAAIQGGILTGELDSVLLLDVIPLSLGIETQGGMFTKLIERNRTIPTSCTEIFTTADDYQSIVNIHVLQGERPMAKDNKTLARFELVGIPPARRGIPKIEVTFEVDVNGILAVAAKDLGTGKEQSIRIRSSSGLSEKEIEKMIDEADDYRQVDTNKKELANLRNKADGLIYTTERSMGEFVQYLTDDEIKQIQEDIIQCRTALEEDDAENIRRAMGRLEKSSYKIAEVMYKDYS